MKGLVVVTVLAVLSLPVHAVPPDPDVRLKLPDLGWPTDATVAAWRLQDAPPGSPSQAAVDKATKGVDWETIIITGMLLVTLGTVAVTAIEANKRAE